LRYTHRASLPLTYAIFAVLMVSAYADHGIPISRMLGKCADAYSLQLAEWNLTGWRTALIKTASLPRPIAGIGWKNCCFYSHPSVEFRIFARVTMEHKQEVGSFFIKRGQRFLRPFF